MNGHIYGICKIMRTYVLVFVIILATEDIARVQPYQVDGSFETREYPVQQIFLLSLLYNIVEESIRKIS
jgi:hypothetical protein